MANTNRKVPLSLMMVLCVLMLIAGILAGTKWKSDSSVETAPEFNLTRNRAYEAISRSEWDQARELFEQLRELANKVSVTARQRDEIEGSLKMLKAIASGPTPTSEPPVPVGTDVEVEPLESSPPKLPEEVILERYPVGKTIRSVAHLYATGKGSNADWGIKGTSHFGYLSQVSAETKVVESDVKNGRLVFEQSFGLTMQELVVSDQQLELVPPDFLPIRVLWPIADNVMRREPRYDKLRRLIDVINKVDPNLKKTLTTVHGWLKRGGIELRPTDDIEIKVLVDKLAGTKFRIVYLSGIGVTSITPLADEQFDRGELIRLARSCNVMVDYFVFPLTKRKPGEQWEVQANDVGNLFAFYDPIAQLSGSIKFIRGADEPAGEDARLEIKGGRVRAHSATGGASTETNMVIEDGTAWFNQKDQYVRRANMKFSATGMFQSRDHLLFGTDRMRDLKIESRYEAELIDAGGKSGIVLPQK